MSVGSSLSGPSAVLEATNHHPYARFATGMASSVAGVAADDAVLWWSDGPLGLLGHGLGSPTTLESLVPRLPRVKRTNLPRGSACPPDHVVFEEWDFRWLTGPVEPVAGADRVERITDEKAINALLDVAFPDSMLRPGHPMVLNWYGIWSGDRLAACAADRSSPSVGVLGGIAVHPRHRRQGLGAAVTVALTELLVPRYPLVGLGVVAENTAATDLYARLGFAGVHEITGVRRP